MMVIGIFKIGWNFLKIGWNGLLFLLFYLLDLLLTIPQIITAQLNAHKRLIVVGVFAAIYLIGIHVAFPDMKFVDAVVWLFSSGQFKSKAGIILFVSALLPALFLRFVVSPIAAFVDRIDDTLYNFYYIRSKSIRLSLRSISSTFDSMHFGSYREQELFEMDEFKSLYAPFI